MWGRASSATETPGHRDPNSEAAPKRGPCPAGREPCKSLAARASPAAGKCSWLPVEAGLSLKIYF